ncbi:hypothetical protein AVEN_267739-1 [Araneus ventricosus]|uniref:USP domain-containing protein n=1 Tax=Araneus ventricosus TaxID=182803 RepID=A0A4Y2CYX2_ARAVE|nr:hypothetical protein AVEN_267739-1 [Araneus ventricosus]
MNLTATTRHYDFLFLDWYSIIKSVKTTSGESNTREKSAKLPEAKKFKSDPLKQTEKTKIASDITPPILRDISSEIESFEVTRTLVNLGKSCFLNAILQALAHTRKLITYFQSEIFEDHIKNNSCPVTRELVKVLMELWKSSKVPVCPADLKIVEGPELKEESIITEIFESTLRSHLECTNCSHSTYKYETMKSFSVAISEETTSISDCLNLFLSKETIFGKICENCESHDAQKWYSIRKSPKVLVIHIKRFDYVFTGKKPKALKLDVEIVMPSCIYLPQEDENGQISMKEYELYSCVEHFGSKPTGGHSLLVSELRAVSKSVTISFEIWFAGLKPVLNRHKSSRTTVPNAWDAALLWASNSLLEGRGMLVKNQVEET